MIQTLSDRLTRRNLVVAGVTLLAWLVCIVLGSQASPRWLAALLGLGVAALLIYRINLGLYLIIFSALAIPFQVDTGTEVNLNASVAAVGGVLGLWVILMRPYPQLRPVFKRHDLPLVLFLLSGLLSIIAGQALWDTFVPRPNNFTLVQFGQWAIFVFSGCMLWFTGRVIRDPAQLRRVTFFFLVIAGLLAAVLLIPGSDNLGIGTYALQRAPFWMLLAALSLGQLLFNRDLATPSRLLLFGILGLLVAYAFFDQRERLSNMVGVTAVAAVLLFSRFRRLRWVFVVGLLASLVLFRTQIYNFAGGDSKWNESGASRLVLIDRVVSVTARNPITGLGPAAYRSYARMQPLPYAGAYWVDPLVNSHNNYVDLYSQLGLLGLGLFAWFAIELLRLGWQVRARFRGGFLGAYANSMLALWVGSLVLMLFADWILPFVYNIGFTGFQASILVWLFLGGLPALSRFEPDSIPT